MCGADLDPREEPAGMKWMIEYQAAIIKKLRDEAHYKCPSSWRAFIAPDFTRKLQPGECLFRLRKCGYVRGDVLVARNPCTAPWDVRKLRALGQREVLQRFGACGYPLLHENVLLLSAHSSCDFAPAHYLAGGDYDGDTVVIIAHRPIVDLFSNAHYDKGIVEEIECLASGASSHSSAAEVDVRTSAEAVLQAHWKEIQNNILKGSLGNEWAYNADAHGVDVGGSRARGLRFPEAACLKIPSLLCCCIQNYHILSLWGGGCELII